jgi:peptidyl-prolyl cis-trans isomerase A (cyclophilin A)
MSMKRRDFVVAAGVLAAGQVPAPAPAATPAPVPAPPAGPRVNLRTREGLIVIEVYPDKAPVTAGNFLRLVDQKRFDGSTIYRASRTPGDPTTGVIQGGIKFDGARPVKPIAHEPTTTTGLAHKDGTISMGRLAPGTAVSDFFIVIGDGAYLDAHPDQPGDNLGYAAFGRVVEGMDVVKAILAKPTSPTKGPMVGQMLEPPEPIMNARRAVQG